MNGNARPTLRLNTAKFDEVAALVIGARTDRELAAKLGVSGPHLSQIRNHHRSPGEKFIAACRNAMPHVAFEQIFETVTSAASDAT